jgi:outer membrane biosynthesis protein TonB
VLRGTIGVLETTVEKLETPPPPGAEGTPSFLQQLETRWSRFLLKTRAFIPSNLSTKLSDTALTGMIAGIAVVLVWTTTNIFTNKPTEVATLPPVEEVPTPTPTPTIPTPPETSTPEPSPAEEIIPEPETTTPPPEPETTKPPSEPEPTPTPTPTPTPVIQLTPEQALIAAIENQLAEISNELRSSGGDAIAPSIVKSIQANFRTSSLTVKINDDWYTLKESEQNKIASQILQRSKELDFSHLEIIDSQDKLVARNPVIGNEMIIFRVSH